MDYTLDEKIIGNKLKELRNKKGLSQREVATEINISREHYSRIENGTKGISLYMLFILMNYYGEDANSILGVKKA